MVPRAPLFLSHLYTNRNIRGRDKSSACMGNHDPELEYTSTRRGLPFRAKQKFSLRLLHYNAGGLADNLQEHRSHNVESYYQQVECTLNKPKSWAINQCKQKTLIDTPISS